MRKRNSVLKFLSIIDSIPVNEHGCKIWCMGINSSGYGNYSISDQTYSVHRLLFTTIHNRSYYGLVVRHKCDNRACCNIEHLEIGTQSENIMDASKKNRLLKGSQNNKSVFSEELVKEIRDQYPTKSTIELAKKYNTHPQTIRSLIIGRTWAHVPGAKPLMIYKRALGEKMGRSKLTNSQVLDIRSKYPKIKAPKLAKEYGVGHAMIYNIIKRKNWTHI